MEGRITNEYQPKASSVREFAYLEDRNYPIRQTMEDSNWRVIQITSPSIASARIAIVGYSQSSMDTEAPKLWSTVQRLPLRYSVEGL